MVANRSGVSGPEDGWPWCQLVVVRRIAWLAFIGAATPLDTTPSVWKVNRPQHFGLTELEFPGRDPALWDALGTRLEPTAPGPSRRVHHPIVAPRSRPRHTDSATHNESPQPSQHPHSSSPLHPQVPHFWEPRATLATTPGHRVGRASPTPLQTPTATRSKGGGSRVHAVPPAPGPRRRTASSPGRPRRAGQGVRVTAGSPPLGLTASGRRRRGPAAGEPVAGPRGCVRTHADTCQPWRALNRGSLRLIT